MSTLFNLFCPIFLKSLNGVFCYFFYYCFIIIITMNLFKKYLNKKNSLILLSGFVYLLFMNLLSLISFGFSMTSSLWFNLNMALILWMISLIIIFLKYQALSVLNPFNSPWYLMPFLSLIELISSMIRPITLSLRLLANLSAGHIILSLFSLNFFNIFLILMSSLEFFVSLIQAFVFLVLIKIYLEESLLL